MIKSFIKLFLTLSPMLLLSPVLVARTEGTTSGVGFVDTKRNLTYTGLNLDANWCISKVTSNKLDCQNRDHTDNFLWDQNYESFCYLRVQTRHIDENTPSGVVLSRNYNQHIAYKIFESLPRPLLIINHALDIALIPLMNVEQLDIFNNSITQVIQKLQGKPDESEALDSISNVINQRACANLKLASKKVDTNIITSKIKKVSPCSEPILLHKINYREYESCFSVLYDETVNETIVNIDKDGYFIDGNYSPRNYSRGRTETICKSYDAEDSHFNVKKSALEQCNATRSFHENLRNTKQ